VTIREVILMADTPSTLNSKRMKNFVVPDYKAGGVRTDISGFAEPPVRLC